MRERLVEAQLKDEAHVSMIEELANPHHLLHFLAAVLPLTTPA